MSLMPKKRKAPTEGQLRPDDVVLKPKPSMHAAVQRKTQKLGASTSTGDLKKQRLDFSATKTASTSAITTSVVVGVAPSVKYSDDSWKEFCANSPCPPSLNLEDQLKSAASEAKFNKMAKIMCAAIRETIENGEGGLEQLRECILCAALKEFAPKLTNKSLLLALLTQLSEEPKKSSDSALMVIKLRVAQLRALLLGIPHWDPAVASAIIRDMLSDRIWVDTAPDLVQSIFSAVPKIFATRAMYVQNGMEQLYSDSNQLAIENAAERLVSSPGELKALESEILEPLRRFCDSRVAAETPNRHLLNLLTSLAGISEARLLAARRLDLWLVNGKVQRYALELLLHVALNLAAPNKNPHDLETLSLILTMRSLKSKQILGVLQTGLKEVFTQDSGWIQMATRQILSNEFSGASSRSPHNCAVLLSLFNIDSKIATKSLGAEMANVALSGGEIGERNTRLLLKELVRSSLRTDFHASVFIDAYLQRVQEDGNLRKNNVLAALEVSQMSQLLLVTPGIRETAAAARRTGQGNFEQLAKVAQEFTSAAVSLVNFLLTPKIRALFGTSDNDEQFYVAALQKTLFLEQDVDAYTPTAFSSSSAMETPLFADADLPAAIRIIGEAPLSVDVVRKLMDQKIPLRAADAVELIWRLTRRSAIAQSQLGESFPLLADAEELALFEQLMERTSFDLPKGVEAEADLSLAKPYWTAWLCGLLWLCAGKPAVPDFAEAYRKFPQLRVIVQMTLTGQFIFPLADGETMSEQDVQTADEQAADDEERIILELENKLVGHAVSATSSSFLSNVCIRAPSGPARAPPTWTLKELSRLASDVQLGVALCKSREPDLLAKMVATHGPHRALPIIEKLVVSGSSGRRASFLSS